MNQDNKEEDMDLGSEYANNIYARWLPDYIKRAAEVEQAISKLFTRALEKERQGALFKNQGVTTSLEYLKEQRKIFPHAIVLFLYSSHYDQKTIDELLDQEAVKAALINDLTPREIFERKAVRLDKSFRVFTLLADSLAHHYVLALMGMMTGLIYPWSGNYPLMTKPRLAIPPMRCGGSIFNMPAKCLGRLWIMADLRIHTVMN